LLESGGEPLEEEPVKQAGKRLHGQEEVRPAMNPACAVPREAAAGDDTVKMGIMRERLAPAVQHGESTDLGAETARIGGQRGQCFGRGLEQDPDEFIRRFLLHTLPDGFHRIRHLGFLANGHRATKLALARVLLKATSETEPADAAASATANESPSQPTADRDVPACPICGGIVRVTSYLPAGSKRLGSAAAMFRCDTS